MRIMVGVFSRRIFSGLSQAGDVSNTLQNEEVRAHPVFDPAITLPDPYDDGPGPWYDWQKVKEIERETGIKFVAR